MTRRIVYTASLLLSFHSAYASMYWCHIEGTFFTHPRPEVHNNMDYDDLARKYIDMMVNLIKTYECSPEYALKMTKVHAEREYLAFPKPTMQKFIEDLSEIKDPNQILAIMGVNAW